MIKGSNERLRYLIGRLALLERSAIIEMDGGRIEELCHLILRELQGETIEEFIARRRAEAARGEV